MKNMTCSLTCDAYIQATTFAIFLWVLCHHVLCYSYIFLRLFPRGIIANGIGTEHELRQYYNVLLASRGVSRDLEMG